MNLLKKYIVLTLTLLVTLSASGVSISVHKCCGKIKDLSFFGALSKCSMYEKKSEVLLKCKKHHTVYTKASGKVCCSEQKIVVQKTDEAVQKSQLKEKASFDVLFALDFVRNWLGLYSNKDDEENDEPSSAPSISQSLTILFRQFRI